MNKKMLEEGLARLDAMTQVEFGQSLIDAGFDVVLRQYPEPPPSGRVITDCSGSMRRRTERDAEDAGEPFGHAFLEPLTDG